MLNLIRDNIQSFGVKFIVGIVIVVMSFFGISAYQSQSSNTLVTVDGYEVKIDKYQRAYENAREEVRRRYGNQASDYLKMVNLDAQVIRQLTSNALLLKSAEKNGLAISDKELAHEIYSNPAFLTDDRFDPAKYENSLRAYRTDKIGFEKDLKENLLSQKFLQFVNTGALISRKSLEEEYRRYESVLKIKVIEFDPALFGDEVKVSDKDIESYYELHKADFQQKTQYDLKYFVVGVDDVKDEVKVREREIQKYYENNAVQEFTNKASFHARHILIAIPQDQNQKAMEEAKKKADSIYQQLQNNPDKFSALAKQYSDDPGSARKGGDLGWVEKGSFVEEFETVVSQLKKNQLSKPFLSNFGYHIVELIDQKPESVKPFEDVKADIEKRIRDNKAKRRIDNLVKKLVVDSAGQSIEDMATSVKKTVKQTGEFDDTKELPDIGYTYQLYQALQEKTANQKGQFDLAGDQKILVYEIAAVKEPFIKPLDDVKEQVRFYAREEAKEKLAQKELNDYESQVKTIEGFDKVAVTLKTQSIPVTFKFSDRKVGNLNVTERFKTEAFKLENGEVRAIKDSNRGYLVYMVDKKKGKLDENSRKTLDNLEKILINQKSQVVLNDLINKLQKDVDVEYNTQLLNAMNIKL